MIKVTDEWYIKFSELSVDVYYRYVHQETGEVYMKPKLYFSNLELALKGIIDRSLCNDVSELQAVVDSITSLKQDIKRFCSKNDLLRARSLDDLYRMNGKV